MEKRLSPLEFFGFEPGSDYHMIPWEDIVAYFWHLDACSARVRVEEVGKSTLGHPFLRAFITSEANMERLEEYRQISCRLADPEGLTQAEIRDLARRGKAVCIQTYSLHANEVGGTQSAPSIAWQLANAEEYGLSQVLENCIFIMVPCANPDGELMYTHWYERSMGTSWEGTPYPNVYHIYAGHDNNRDFIHEQLVESRYINDIIIRDWMPQALMDHHHQCPDENRISIPPSCNPNWPELSPLLTRADQLYGAEIACALEEAGLKGVVMGDSWYNTYPFYSLSQTCSHANTVGMLTESADAKIATPVYIHPDRLWRYTQKCVECPSPWPGGRWGLPDIVNEIRLASLALLKAMARDRENVLIRKARMALQQTERGRDAEIKGYVIPREQQDASILQQLLDILNRQRVRYEELARDATLDGERFPEGAYFVPCSQPRYSLVGLIFARRPYPVEANTTWPDGTVHVFDNASTNVFDPMGLVVRPVTHVPDELRPAGALLPTPEDRMPANENRSYEKANRLLGKGLPLWRDGAGDFFAEPVAGAHAVRAMRVALLNTSNNQNGNMGAIRHVLENFCFPIKMLKDQELRAGGLKDFDVLILPGFHEGQLTSGDTVREGDPEEFNTGLGTDGAEEVRRFVKGGGRLIALDKSCAYPIKLFGLKINDTTNSKGAGSFYEHNPDYNCLGSILNADLEADPVTRGMPRRTLIKSKSGPAFKINAYDRAWNYKSIARYAARDVLNNGLLIGEKFLAGNTCIARAKVENGEVLLYAFDPIYRGHGMGTFKLLFNALYAEDMVERGNSLPG